ILTLICILFHFYARLECMARCILFPDDSESTDDIWVIVIRGITRGTVGEINSFPIPITL
ncbi:hypothetical protein Gohar_027042, partial [Gossypium harknessii]|nr:hypothetical protein [Gossypium harknessii]